MTGYEWTCLACGRINGSSIDLCAACGCPSNANAEMVKKYRDPKAYEENKEKEGFEKIIALIIAIPVWSLLYVLKGNILFGLLLIGTAAIILSKEREVMRNVISDSWGVGVISCYIAITVGFILFRFVTGDNLSTSWLFASILLFVVLNIGMFYYAFKSDNAKEFYERYKQVKLTKGSY